MIDDGEVRMMRAVIVTALIDAATPICPRRPAETENHFNGRRIKETGIQRDAREWLLDDTEDFPMIASFAGYDATDLRERARKMANSGWCDMRITADERIAA
jgi:hypothetical protein